MKKLLQSCQSSNKAKSQPKEESNKTLSLKLEVAKHQQVKAKCSKMQTKS